jgi:ABC-type antimicrobial peptide transport system permease subunit
MTALLHERHHIREGESDDFTIRDMTEMSNTLSSTTRLMTNLLLCVAMISLIVGGVGIMNIMLVSVTERTREIGLRMSVGARARDILRQFLVEAIVLCLVGGAVGILLGHGGSLLVRMLLRWPVETSPTAIAAAVIVSAAVGILFGYYPAWKASRLDPIEALRMTLPDDVAVSVRGALCKRRRIWIADCGLRIEESNRANLLSAIIHPQSVP